MPYRRNNYSFVIDSNFQPFTLQEMLVPFTAYKDAYEKQESAMEDIANRDIFKVLADLPEGSKSKAIYEGYINDFNSQSDNFSKNGLTMQNRRALHNLKKRYGQEIGRLEAANTALQEEKKLRRANKDTSMLYANDNLNIDDFLDGANPNLYGISGTELYTRGAAAGKAASSRVYSAGDEGSTLGGYYRKWVERNGYSKESMDAFRANASAIPELQQAADDILAERGATENLTGNNLERARQSVINGIIDGAVYTEKVNPVRDPGVMSASERDASARGWAANTRAQEEWNMKKQAYEDERKLKYTFDENGNVTGLNPNYINNSNKTPEQKAIEEMQKKEVVDRMQKAQKVKNARTVEEADKAGYVPVLATVHPSHGSSSGLSVEEARKQQKYDNIDGWRSGTQGRDVPNLYIDWTNAPLVEGSQSVVPDLFQWFSGSSSSPNNGDFSYNLKNAQTKMLSDQEYNKLPEAVRISIEESMKQQGYADGTPYEVMQVTGREGKTSYLTFVPKDNQILLGD